MSRVSWGLGVRCAEDVHLVVFVAGLELKKFFFSHQSFVITAYQQTKRPKDEERLAKPRKVLSYPDKAAPKAWPQRPWTFEFCLDVEGWQLTMR